MAKSFRIHQRTSFSSFNSFLRGGCSSPVVLCIETIKNEKSAPRYERTNSYELTASPGRYQLNPGLRQQATANVFALTPLFPPKQGPICAHILSLLQSSFGTRSWRHSREKNLT